MSRPTFDSTISLSHILTAGAMCVGLVLGWARMQSGQDNLMSELTRTNESVQRLTSSQAAVEKRVRANEEYNARMDERFSIILSQNAKLEGSVAKLEEKIDRLYERIAN